MKPDHKYTINEALDILRPNGVGRTTLYKHITRGTIKTSPILGKVFITHAELQKLIRLYVTPAGWVTFDDARALLKIGKQTMFKLIKNNQLRPIKRGGVLYFDPNEIDILNL